MQFYLKLSVVLFLVSYASGSEVIPEPQTTLDLGPQVGAVTHETAVVWLRTSAPANLRLRYWPVNHPEVAKLTERIHTESKTDLLAKIPLTNLEEHRDWGYEVILDQHPLAMDFPLEFRTAPPPGSAENFTIALGSCHYVNDPSLDPPNAEPYGGDYEIFQAISTQKPEFMLWLGDNTYYRPPDLHSEEGLRSRWRFDRRHPPTRDFLARGAHVAIWDDHDFGDDNSHAAYALNTSSRKVFTDYWPMVPRPHSQEGIYRQVTWGDVDFFLLDNRSHRQPDLPVSPEKSMLGTRQLSWLLKSLATSQASFKVIVGGNQFLNGAIPDKYEGLHHFPKEKETLMRFLQRKKIPGVFFLSGDRHHSEALEAPRAGTYPLRELTVSPLTAGTSAHEAEKDNPLRIQGSWVRSRRSFGLLHFRGQGKNRSVTFELRGVDGVPLWSKRLELRDLGVE